MVTIGEGRKRPGDLCLSSMFCVLSSTYSTLLVNTGHFAWVGFDACYVAPQWRFASIQKFILTQLIFPLHYKTLATVERYMGNQVYLRPLILLAKQGLAVPRRATKVKANTQRHLSTCQYSCYTSNFDLLTSFVTKYRHASTIAPRCRPLSCAPASPGHSFQRRMFSVSPDAKAAVVTSNPRKDEDGNEMLIDITARAAKVFSVPFSRPHHLTTAYNAPSVFKK